MNTELEAPYGYVDGYIYLSVAIPIDRLPRSVEVGAKTLNRKTEFHVSLVCVKCIASLYEKLGKKTDEDLIKEVIAKFAAYVQEHSIIFLGFTDEFRHAIRGEEETIVGCCDVSNLVEFFDELNREYGTNISYQPTHVTLYTFKTNIGIGISSKKQMESYEIVEVPEVKNILLET